YTLTVTDSCSSQSNSVTIGQPTQTSEPTIVKITQPTCSASTGSFQINGYDSTNTYTFTPSIVSISSTGLVTANAGSYTFTVTNVQGCISLPSVEIVLSNVICAVTETTPSINGLPGGTTAPLTTNDTLNGNPVVIGTSPGQVTLSAVTVPSGLTLNADGTVTIAPNTPAGNYNVEYKICEVTNPNNCDTVLSVIVVGNATIQAQNDDIEVDSPIVTVVLRPFNEDHGNGEDTLDGVKVTFDKVNVTITEIILPSGQSYPVPNVDINSNEIVIPTSVPAGVYTISYTICEKLNPTNCSSAVINIRVKSPIVIAEDDVLPSVDGKLGTSNAGNVLEPNPTKPDTINGNPITSNEVVIAVITPAIPVFPNSLVPILDTTTGIVSVPANTPAGDYTIVYAICDKVNPTSCDTAVVSITVKAPVIVAQDDYFYEGLGFIGNANIGNILNNNGDGNDTLDNSKATIAQVQIKIVQPANAINGGSVPMVDVATGNVSVPPGTEPGVYTIVYSICDRLNPTICDEATITIEVSNPAPAPPTLDAVNDTVDNINGINGAKKVLTILSNDTYELTAATINNVSIKIITPDVSGNLILNPDGTVDVKEGTPQGSYSFVYEICSMSSPNICDQATVTVNVICNSTKISGVVRDLLNNRPLANVPVTLIPDKQTTGPVLFMLTKADGSYNFTGFIPGDYIIQVQDANLNNAQNLYNVGPSLYFLNIQNCNYEVRNFDYDKTDLPVLGNLVWYDLNSNGLQDEWFDANNDGLVTQNFPDNNGYYDYAKWEWIDFNGDGSYVGKANEGELNAAGIGNGTTNVPNIFVTGPNGFSRQITMGIQGYWRTRGLAGQWGDYKVELIMESNLETAAQKKRATGLIKNLPAPINKFGTSKNTGMNSFIVCGVTNNNSKNTTLSAVIPTDNSMDFGIQCSTFATILANNDAATVTSSIIATINVVNVLNNDSFNGSSMLLTNVNLTTVTPNANLRLNADGSVDVLPNTPAGSYTLSYQVCEKVNPSNCQTATVTITVVAPIIVATNDDYSATPIDASKGAVLEELVNDKLNNETIQPNQVVVTIADAGGINGVTVDSQGKIVIPAGTPIGTYVLTYTICDVVNPNNCASATITIVVKDPCDFDDSPASCDIEIHNSFSPDNDGQNEVFTIDRIENYPDNTVEIYNRWGVLVFEVNGYDNTSKVFTGISEGRVTVNKEETLPNGTYYYVVKYKKPISGSVKQKAGFLYLSR
ncbi:gliding motility-associated C-terminal domain-containing protein, partial [Flavobacterium sp. RSSA_27]|uniref:T9SS type B sorting domain-containing protein n=1 Tax=Flavobacterium sp. RSSA_27 TaxID=3447667 RepID=UPI003F3BF4D8